ncbi:MAG: CDP-glycerol glycerophosphotransferase family protein [Psychrobacillus psychrotolerans]
MELKKKERFENISTFLKVVFAFGLSKLIRKKSNRKIVLVGGNLGEKYEDNASVFHRYLVENYQKELDIHWMYDPSTTYVRKLNIPNAVKLGTLKNYLLFFRADHTIHGHSLSFDIAPSIDKYIFFNRKTIMTHISHGIEGFKKILIQEEDIPLLSRCNYFNCASEYEKGIKLKEWGIPEEKLLVTGMARFDNYEYNSPASRVENVLIMFTWREWLFDLSEEDFLSSDYFKKTVEVLSDNHLLALFENRQVKVKVVLHPFMKKFEQYFTKMQTTATNIKFYSFDEISIGDEMKEADMLLTDYSSIAWDFLYMNKPIIFFTFDQKEYLNMRGSYIDLDKDLFGYKADTTEEVKKYMDLILMDGHSTNPYSKEGIRFLDYFDQRSCERLASQLFK